MFLNFLILEDLTKLANHRHKRSMPIRDRMHQCAPLLLITHPEITFKLSIDFQKCQISLNCSLNQICFWMRLGFLLKTRIILMLPVFSYPIWCCLDLLDPMWNK